MQTVSRKILLGLLATAAIGISPAHAVDSVTGSTDAGRVEQRLEPRAMPRSVEGQALDVKSNMAVSAPAGAEKMTLTLNSVDVEGASIYSPAEINAFFADKIGQTITLADVYGMAAALTAKYRNDGYILTQVIIPPQTIDGGHVKFQAVEGYVDNVQINGEMSEYERGIITGYTHYIKSSTATNIRDLEQALLLINDLPGVTARSVLAPSANKIGAADITIFIERKPYDGALGFDNYGSPYLGYNEMSAAFATNALLGLGERIEVNAVYAPGKELNKELAYGSISYEQPVGSYGTMLSARASQAFTEPGDSLHDFNINGRSTYVEFRALQPIIRTRAFSLNLRAQLDGRMSETTSNIDVERIDNIRSFRVGSAINFSDTLFGAAINNLDIELSKGLGIFGASDKGDANLSRTAGDPEYLKFELEAQRLQRIINKLNLLVGFKGQTSSDALLSSEEFGVGGSSYGRGYDPSEIVGDKGIAGKAELQWSNPVEGTFFDNYQLFAFYDAGRVWNKDATTSADKVNSLASAGMGIRGNFLFGTDLEAFWALPLTNEVGSETNNNPRVSFKVVRPF